LNQRPLEPHSSALPSALHPDMRSNSALNYISTSRLKMQALFSKKPLFFLCDVFHPSQQHKTALHSMAKRQY
ncbi:MAG: hypothetical protein J6J62_08685, partial [Oscillospiraceae bacterium]|nr:hypothetical protein [Oscillospiraceae bacterium]